VRVARVIAINQRQEPVGTLQTPVVPLPRMQRAGNSHAGPVTVLQAVPSAAFALHVPDSPAPASPLAV
jgi:hypothetical protein